MWMMGIANSYTMEATFGGSLLGNRAQSHFSVQDFEQMGRVFCQTLLDFYDDDPRKVLWIKVQLKLRNFRLLKYSKLVLVFCLLIVWLTYNK